MHGHAEYKRQNIKIWDEMAPRYHRRWAGADTGPWKSSDRLVRLAGIKPGDRVLDVACGTGAVTKKISEKIGRDGMAVGIDTSAAAIRIARRWNGRRRNLDFVNGDAERFSFGEEFDAVTCQYALFFFPNSQRALRNMAKSLKPDGVLGISVHGNDTPYFSSIVDVVTEFIPDYLPAGAAKLDRFGTAAALKKEQKMAGLRRVSVREFNFPFSPGTFEDYWGNYRRYAARPIREKLKRLPRGDQLEIRRRVREKTARYAGKDQRIVFPWQVLISTARPPS